MGRLKNDVRLSQFQTDTVTILAYTGIRPYRIKFRLVYDEKYENKPIEDMFLETTEMRLVNRIGIKTFGDVIDRWKTIPYSSLNVKGIGKMALMRFRTRRLKT